jgi:glycosyltransferase involved in cell wall biosynthesis
MSIDRAHRGGVPRAVTLLTNFVPPYRVAFFAALAKRVRALRILVSTRMERNRSWCFERGGLPVEVQRTLTLPRIWRHPAGFSEWASLHVPLDTLALLWRRPPEVIVSGELGFRTLQAVIFRRLNASTRVVVWACVSERSEQGRGFARERLRRWLLARADAVVVNGESGARYVARFHFPEAATFRVPYTIEAAPFSDAVRSLRTAAPPPRRLLYVGQLIERKAVGALLSAVSRWAGDHPDTAVELWIVGDGPERRALEQKIVPDNLAVEFWGDVAYSELPGFYARASIFVFPTLADEWGVVVNEAMAAGLPVLGSLYSQAVEEMVEDGATGWTFRPDRLEEVAAAVDRALSTPPGDLERMRESCLASASRFTPEIAADRMLDAIEYAAAKPTRPRQGADLAR